MVCSPFRVMNSTLLDPNNHVPEVSPDDGWGDAEGFSPGTTAGSANVLPPRRTMADRPSAAAVATADSGHSGLRIESNLLRRESTDVLLRLEIQEINGTVVRLDPMVSAPPKVPRQVTFHERPARETYGKKSSEGRLQWGLGHRHPTRWILGAGAVVAAIIVSAMMLLPAINAPRTVPRTEPVTAQNNPPLGSRTAAKSVVDRRDASP